MTSKIDVVEALKHGVLTTAGHAGGCDACAHANQVIAAAIPVAEAMTRVREAASRLDKAITSAHALPKNEDAGEVINAMWVDLRLALAALRKAEKDNPA